MSTIKNTKWQMVYQNQEIVHLPEEDWLHENGAAPAYKYKSFPPYTSPHWEDAPIDDNGKLNFVKPSRLEGGFTHLPHKQVDFTYFRSIVVIPKNEEITSFKVIIDHVDDGARMYLFNKKNKDGKYIEADDAKRGGDQVSADFTKDVTDGQNTIVIVQFDQNPVLNTLTGGIKIEINGKEIETDQTAKIPETDGLTWKFYWAEDIEVDPNNNKQATGKVNETKFTYTSNVKVETEDHLQAYDAFKSQKALDTDIPDRKNIMNTKKSENTLSFDKEVHDPIILFASIGNSSGTAVTVEFNQEIEVLWQYTDENDKKDRVIVSGNNITGQEGHVIIKVPGKHSEIKFNYTKNEYRVNFFFGYAE
jgi:hypothetical protein